MRTKTPAAGNEYSWREAAGAFGDLGTLIPFLVGYLSVTRLEPVGVIVGFGVFMIAGGSVLQDANCDPADEAFPRAVLGTILMFGGLELAAGTVGASDQRRDRYVAVFTAAVAMWNMGAAYACNAPSIDPAVACHTVQARVSKQVGGTP